ncbi:MAG: hypothetical protein GY730_11520 [bacterium]|nr:hypothetical protein [bacterium]
MNQRIISFFKYFSCSISLFFFSITLFGTYKWVEEYFDGKIWLDWESTSVLTAFTISGGICLGCYFLLLGLKSNYSDKIFSFYKNLVYIFIFSGSIVFIEDIFYSLSTSRSLIKSLPIIAVVACGFIFKNSWIPLNNFLYETQRTSITKK